MCIVHKEPGVLDRVTGVDRASRRRVEYTSVGIYGLENTLVLLLVMEVDHIRDDVTDNRIVVLLLAADTSER